MVFTWGVSFIQIVGILDFSVAAERILGSVIGVLLSRFMGILGLIIGCICTSLAIGLLKALLNKFIRMKSIVITIAYTMILGSLGALVQGQSSMILISEACKLGQEPFIWIITIFVGVFAYILHNSYRYTSLARALGSNEKLTSESGVSIAKTEGIMISICSFFVGISGILATSYGAGTAAMAGLESMSLVFPAVIGYQIGKLLERRVNIVLGCIIGIFTMNTLATGLISLSIPSQLKDTVTGAFLLILLISSSYLDRRKVQLLRRQASENRFNEKSYT